MSKVPQEQQPSSQATLQGAVELDESQLEQAHGGGAYIKFDGIDGTVDLKHVVKVEALTIKQK